MHAISTGCIRMRRNRYSINPYSVKEAIDTMDAGIAFFDNGYKLLLSNVIMNSLLTDDISRTIKYNSGFISVIDGKSYEFSKETISSGDFTFIQVMAVDITEALQLNHDLELKNMNPVSDICRSRWRWSARFLLVRNPELSVCRSR